MTKRSDQEIAAVIPYDAPRGEISRRMNPAELVQEFLASRDIRPASKEAYRKGLERFFLWLEKNGIEQPDIKAVLQFKTYLQEMNLSPNTVNAYLSSIRAFFAFLEASRLYPNIARAVKRVKTENGHLRDAPTKDQARATMDSVDGSTIHGLRDRAMIDLMARTGCRTVELIRANVGDIRQREGETVLYVWGKGRDSADHFKLLGEKTLSSIHGYLAARGPVKQGDPLFVSHSDRNPGGRLTTRTIRGVVKKHFRKVGIDSSRLSAHSLRHFCATEAIRAGASLLAVRDMLGHSSVKTTEIYLHNLDRMKCAAERFVDF